MRFGDIRRILDYYAGDCLSCSDGTPDYCPHTDCSAYYANLIKKEIMTLLDKEEVDTSSVGKIPCTLSFKGCVDKLPETAEEGDTYIVKDDNGEATFYFYGGWNCV